MYKRTFDKGGQTVNRRPAIYIIRSEFSLRTPIPARLPEKVLHLKLHVTANFTSCTYITMSPEMVSQRLRIIGAVVALAIPAIHLLRRMSSLRRQRSLPSPERVLILGASSGVGHAIAQRYARRGARVCVVARRADKIHALAEECGDECIGIAADLSVVEDMVRVRQAIVQAWEGLDTIHLCAGVSALQPVLALAGAEEDCDTTVEGIQNAKEIAGKAVQGNFLGPLVAAMTFVGGLSSPLKTFTVPS